MINYLIFPGITDQPAEVAAMRRLIAETSPDLIHMKNLNIDPHFYWQAMAPPAEPGLGLRAVKDLLAGDFPDLRFGYYNKTKEAFRQ
jgi:hypothetical protein